MQSSQSLTAALCHRCKTSQGCSPLSVLYKNGHEHRAVHFKSIWYHLPMMSELSSSVRFFKLDSIPLKGYMRMSEFSTFSCVSSDVVFQKLANLSNFFRFPCMKSCNATNTLARRHSEPVLVPMAATLTWGTGPAVTRQLQAPVESACPQVPDTGTTPAPRALRVCTEAGHRSRQRQAQSSLPGQAGHCGRGTALTSPQVATAPHSPPPHSQMRLQGARWRTVH